MELLKSLKEQVAQGEVLVVAGAGVGMAAAPGMPFTSWKGLVRHGLERAKELGRITQKQLDGRLADLDDEDIVTLLNVAEFLQAKLTPPGEFSRWLRDTVGSLTAADPALPRAIARLAEPGNRLSTTNYDSLLTEVTGCQPILVSDVAKVGDFIQRDRKGILHLHGHWETPGSVVLGIRDYARTLGHGFTQVLQQSFAMHTSLLFVGCGGTVDDPNLGQLLEWIDTILPETHHRHYLLCRESEVPGYQDRGWQRLYPVPFGKNHGDLPGFLTGLLPKAAPSLPPAAKAAPPPLVGRLPPKPPHFTGRVTELAQAKAALLAAPPVPVALLGGGGMGKSALSLAVAHDREILGHYPRRLFVKLEGARTAGDMVQLVSQALGLEVGPDPMPRTLAALAAQPTLLILDNAETPWEAETLGTEEALSELGTVPGVGLILSIRRNAAPAGLAWERVSLIPLHPDEARALFLEIAGKGLANDKNLPTLLKAVDGIPLALTLLAHLAQGEMSLDDLWKSWQRQRAGLLQRGPGDDRTVNFKASLALSLNSRQFSDAARRLASLLGWLPDGLTPEMRDELLPEDGAQGARALRHLGLVIETGGRLRLLVPVRECIVEGMPPDHGDRDRLLGLFLKLAEDGDKAGTTGGAEAIQRLTPEFFNVEAILERQLSMLPCDRLHSAVAGFAEFQRFTGMGSATLIHQAIDQARKEGNVRVQARWLLYAANLSLTRSDHDGARERFEQALTLYQQVGDPLGEANCIRSLGDIALRRSDHDGARTCYEQALPLYQQVGARLGEANCIQGLGDISLYRADYDGARTRFEQALTLYQQVGDRLGEANCIKSLGDISLYRADHDGARTRFEQALTLYQQVGDRLGEANCIQRLGDIALRRSDHDGARTRFEQALTLYQQVGDRLGEANCIISLGDIALRRSDHDGARTRFEQALPLYQQVGDRLGEANCIKSLGDIALRRSDHDGARTRFEQALTLYQQVGDRLGEANCIKSLGDIALRRSDHDGARTRFEQALTLYQQVGDRLGEANCIQRLGDISLYRADHDGARTRFEQALTLYQQVGSRLGEANCIQSLGDIALRRSDHDGARTRFEQALTLYQQVGDRLGEANCIQRLGDISLYRADHDGARTRFEQALTLYQQVGSRLGEANCIQSLGDIALRRSDHDGARTRFEQALTLYQQVGDRLGEANCIKSLGDIALRRSDHDGARTRFEQALTLYQQVGDRLGEANCIQRLGDISLYRADHDGARTRFEQALTLYQQVGSRLGEANCIQSLGDIALRRSDHDGARTRFEQALTLYRQVGDRLGEANCIKSLGDVVRATDARQARSHFLEALALYQRISAPFSIGFTYLALSEVADSEDEAARCREAARAVWMGAGLDYLVREYLPTDE
ncbi:tetratricopeptide repeat protein [Aerophototrophica crusticola]|uniref:Tetratricopeptide repeat protein n=1 Tax=Aerophototrophica crusticola TaxID=1709002 RepID=A0A858R676_9PROT|nr:tetratricopeptide repeat protein [Rhodospirillaceae bacterium B3]